MPRRSMISSTPRPMSAPSPTPTTAGTRAGPAIPPRRCSATPAATAPTSPSPDAPTSDIGAGRTTGAPRPHFHLPLGPSPLGVFQHDQAVAIRQLPAPRSEAPTSELQSLMRTSYP